MRDPELRGGEHLGHNPNICRSRYLNIHVSPNLCRDLKKPRPELQACHAETYLPDMYRGSLWCIAADLSCTAEQLASNPRVRADHRRCTFAAEPIPTRDPPVCKCRKNWTRHSHSARLRPPRHLSKTSWASESTTSARAPQPKLRILQRHTALPLLTNLHYRAANVDDERATRITLARVEPDLTGAEVVRRDQVPDRMAILAAHSALSRKQPSSTRQQRNMWTMVE
jgi:hypothetical protein